ncbi:hypothetical protein BJX64DRAFT_255227 [Aspergillus heterothallicus]
MASTMKLDMPRKWLFGLILLITSIFFSHNWTVEYSLRGRQQCAMMVCTYSRFI